MKTRAFSISSIVVLLATTRAFGQEEPEPETVVVQPPPAADEPPPPPPQPPKKKTPVGLRFDGGYSPHRLFSLGVTGADLGLGVGPRISEHAQMWGTPRVFVGSTENGLSVWSVRLGGEAEVVFDRLRFGGGVGIFVMGVHRAVRSETLLGYGPDLNVAARFDVVKSDDLAFFVRGAVDGSMELRSGSIFWGPYAGIGVQIELSKKE